MKLCQYILVLTGQELVLRWCPFGKKISNYMYFQTFEKIHVEMLSTYIERQNTAVVMLLLDMFMHKDTIVQVILSRPMLCRIIWFCYLQWVCATPPDCLLVIVAWLYTPCFFRVVCVCCTIIACWLDCFMNVSQLFFVPVMVSNCHLRTLGLSENIF